MSASQATCPRLWGFLWRKHCRHFRYGGFEWIRWRQRYHHVNRAYCCRCKWLGRISVVPDARLWNF